MPLSAHSAECLAQYTAPNCIQPAVSAVQLSRRRPAGRKGPQGLRQGTKRQLQTICAVHQQSGVQPDQDTPRPRKFRPFTSQSPVRQALAEYQHRAHTPNGTLIIQPLTPDWLPSTAELLSHSFGESMGYLPAYRRFLKKHIQQYLTDHVNLIPKTIILTALLLPDGMSGATSDADNIDGDLSEWGSLVGSVEVSCSASTRSRYLTLNPPEEHGYLSNMAVAHKYRRRGYGRLLLEAAEQTCNLSGHRDLFLHLRFQDHAAAVLYRQAGYIEDRRDLPFMFLLGQDRRYLMRKTLDG